MNGGSPNAPSHHPSRARAGVLATAVVLAALGGMAWWWLKPTELPPQAVLTRLTSDSGLTAYPALSPDGKLLAYASDRGGEGNLDLWMRQVAGGEPIRLTRHLADDYEPVFSPDGSTIAFRSERDGGGIYLIGSLGGAERLIAKNGRRPRFSPDGNWIAYTYRVAASIGAFAEGKIYITPSSGGIPKPWQTQFAVASDPVWSPDGKNILFFGKLDAKAPWPQTCDWWVAPVEGAAPVKTGAFDVFYGQGFLGIQGFSGYDLFPEAWVPEGNYVVFSARFGDSTNIWRIPISRRNWQVSGAPQRLTFGAGLEAHPSLAYGSAGNHWTRLVFSSLVENFDIWSLPLRANEGKAAELQRLTQDAAADVSPSISANGHRVAFLSDRAGRRDVWVRDLVRGTDTPLTIKRGNVGFPIITPDGSKVAYSVVASHRREIYVANVDPVPLAVMPERVCEDCGYPRGWSGDGKLILYQSGQPSKVSILEISTGKKWEVLRHPQYDLTSARFSPDDRWVSFVAWAAPGRPRLYIAPFLPAAAGSRINENQWISIAGGEAIDDKPRWSADGNILYFISDRDGFRCIWAQALERGKAPAGPPSAIQHFHQARRTMMTATVEQLELSVARDKIVFTLGERTGNIWLAKTDGQRQ